MTNQSLPFVRFCMILSSLTPLFMLWALRGNKIIPDYCLWGLCAFLIAFPNLILWLRLRKAKTGKRKKTRKIKVLSCKDQREHLLVYLFAMILPLYTAGMETERDLFALLGAFAFIVFLFWHMNLHYMNLLFAFWGYKVFTVGAAGTTDAQPEDEAECTFVVFAKKDQLRKGEWIEAYRIDDLILLDTEVVIKNDT